MVHGPQRHQAIRGSRRGEDVAHHGHTPGNRGVVQAYVVQENGVQGVHRRLVGGVCRESEMHLRTSNQGEGVVLRGGDVGARHQLVLHRVHVQFRGERGVVPGGCNKVPSVRDLDLRFDVERLHPAILQCVHGKGEARLRMHVQSPARLRRYHCNLLRVGRVGHVHLHKHLHRKGGVCDVQTHVARRHRGVRATCQVQRKSGAARIGGYKVAVVEDALDHCRALVVVQVTGGVPPEFLVNFRQRGVWLVRAVRRIQQVQAAVRVEGDVHTARVKVLRNHNMLSTGDAVLC
mmetsp:Transcript_2654/g.4938  ORF Transcript_2654/g.4938 Transcript_2654/m.4938 type:complete len:290 (+) Transcript_2654:6342-7211(+)